MKLPKILVLLGGVVLWVLLDMSLPTEEEREKAKLKEIGNRNILEKQLVGKWNHNDYPAGLDNDRCYHLLSADASYTYRGIEKSKMYGGGHWSIRLSDSVLLIEKKPPHDDIIYKIKEISPDHVRLQQIGKDSLTRLTEWFRHP